MIERVESFGAGQVVKFKMGERRSRQRRISAELPGKGREAEESV